MRKIVMKRRNAFILSIFAILVISLVAFAHNPIPYSIDWTNPNLITMDDTWSVSSALGVRGYSGSDIVAPAGTDARTILAESTMLNVRANQTNPNTLVPGGVAEFEITNPTIAIKGSDTANAPYVNFLVDSRGLSNVRFRCNIRDLDGTNNAVQQVAVQYRLDEMGPFTDVPAGYIADATDPGTATRVTPIDVTLPSDANNITFLEVRVLTVNAVGNDEWIGVDDVVVTGSPTVFSSDCTPTTAVTEGDLFPGGIVSFGVTSGPGTVTADHVNAGSGLQSFTVVSSSNVMISIPAFTPGTFNPVTATFSIVNPNLPVDFTLRAASSFHSAFIRARCACSPTLSIMDDPSLFPGGLASFEVIASGPNEIYADPINTGTGMQTFTVVNATNAVVTIQPFTPGTYDRIFATYTITNPALPVDITLRTTNSFHGVISRLRCGNSTAPQQKKGSK